MNGRKFFFYFLAIVFDIFKHLFVCFITTSYGYRGRDCRHNLYLLPTGEIVYFIAAVVVLYNIDDQIQRHYNGHTSEIRCLTIHPNKLLIATGQNVNQDRYFFPKKNFD